MKTTASAARRANPISWVTTTIVIPSRASPVITSSTSLIISGSRAEVGSSNRISFGSIASARAIATRCCCPPDSWAGYLSRWSATPTRSSSSRALCRAWAWERPRTLTGPSITLSRTVRCANRLKDWKTIPTSARSRASPLPSAGNSFPSTLIVPESIVSSRLIVRHSVDLPDPDGPITTTTWPRFTLRSTSLSTCRSPKCLFTRSSSTSGCAGAPGSSLCTTCGSAITRT